VHALLALAPLAAYAAEPSRETIDLGRSVFTKVAQPSCAVCHALKDAKASGTIGPSLDELRPDMARVKVTVRDGVGVMPAYGEQLTQEQIDAVAAYVVRATSP
jgi:mono/diheme cytochrome c family protein